MITWLYWHLHKKSNQPWYRLKFDFVQLWTGYNMCSTLHILDYAAFMSMKVVAYKANCGWTNKLFA